MLSKLYKKHSKWVNIVNKLGGGDYSEDIVQEMYLKLSKIELKEQTIDTFVYYVLRNMTFDLHRKKSNIFKVDLEDCVFLEYLEDQGKEELETIYERIEDEVEDWHWYDKMLWQLYTEDRTMRELAKDTKISLSSIFHTIKTCKERIKIAVGEDYEDYVNEDYEKI
jgi:RNA polymerase sigma factor (sigma-70 family)